MVRARPSFPALVAAGHEKTRGLPVKNLPPLHGRQTTERGEIEFTSRAAYDDQTANIRHFVHNATTTGIRVDWVGVNEAPIPAGKKEEVGATEALLLGWRRRLLNAPTDAHSHVITRFDGSVGHFETKGVPRYVIRIEALRSVPRGILTGASVVIRTILKLNSPAIVLTAELDVLEQEVPEVRCRFSADVDLDPEYTIEWGANKTAKTGRGRTEIDSFTSQDAIDFVEESATVSRGDWKVTIPVLTPRPIADERLTYDDDSDEQREDGEERNRLMTMGSDLLGEDASGT
jgi:hypothetical protein